MMSNHTAEMESDNLININRSSSKVRSEVNKVIEEEEKKIVLALAGFKNEMEIKGARTAGYKVNKGGVDDVDRFDKLMGRMKAVLKG